MGLSIYFYLCENTAFFYYTLVFLIIGLIIAIFFFKDVKDKPKAEFIEKKSFLQLIIDECVGIYHISKKPLNFFVLLSFLFSEISFYQILFRIEVFNYYYCLIPVPLSIGIGYTLGTIFLKFTRASDETVTVIGLIASIVSLALITLISILKIQNTLNFTIFYAIYSFGYAFFTPAIFSIISPKGHPHLQGKIYGILESIDSFASLLTFIFIFSLKKLSCINLLIFSLIMILISAIFLLFVLKILATTKRHP